MAAAMCRPLAIVLLVVACGGTSDTAASTTPESSTTTTATDPITTTTVLTTTTLPEEAVCVAYALIVSLFASNMIESLTKGSEAATAFINDELSASDAADQLLLSADDLRVVADAMAELDEPPDALKETFRLNGLALERLIEGYELGSRAVRNEDMNMLEASTTLIQWGTAFLVAATDAIGEC